MTGQPPFLIRAVDSDKVREAISGEVARAVNEAAQSIKAVREWADRTVASVRERLDPDSGELPAENTRWHLAGQLAAALEVRALLPAVPPAAEEDTCPATGTSDL